MEGAGLDQEGFINIQLELPEDSQVSGHGRQDSVVSVSVSGVHSHSLSDMAETEDLAEADQSHDVGHVYSTRELWTREDSRELNVDDRDQFMSPSQDANRESYLPEGVFPVRDSDSPLVPVQNNLVHQQHVQEAGGHGHHGLDRVPIRLQSTPANVGHGQVSWSGVGHAAADRIEARRLEEEAVASILDDVLASSPELANTEGSNRAPSP